MRKILISVLCLGFACAAFAGDDPYSSPDWGYAYDDPHYIPNSAPAALHSFYDQLIPMLEARKSAESAYIREYADALYMASKQVPGSLEGTHHQRKHFNRAARSMRQHCKNLRELVHGGHSAALYAQMKLIESDFVKLSNLSDS